MTPRRPAGLDNLRAVRRYTLLLALCAALILPFAGCGSSHRAAPRSGTHRVFHGSVCAFSVWRGTHDARTHHFAFAAFQAYLAAHHCRAAFRRRR